MKESTDNFGSVFAEALTETVSKTSGISLNILSQDSDFDFFGIVSFMSLYGKKRRTLFISVSEDDMRVICSFMTGIPENEIEKEDIYDALCELVNTTAGGAKLMFSGTDNTFTLSSPAAVSGENMSVFTREKRPFTSITLGNGKILIKLKIV